MATVVAPSGIQYVFDSIVFIINGPGEYNIIIDGIKTKISAISDIAIFNASGILKSMFTLNNLSEGTIRKTVSWSVYQYDSVISSGSFTIVYGSNRVINFSGDGQHITLRWISRNGELDTYEFCIYQDSNKIEDIQTAKVNGLNYKVSFDQVNKITLFASMINRVTFYDFTAIQESAIIQASVESGWKNVEVEIKEYKRSRELLQDFDLTIVIPNER